MTYFKRHKQLLARHGRADSRACVDCKEPARHWSLDHHKIDSSTLVLADDRGSARLLSLRDEDYSPRCSRCHGQLDHSNPQHTALSSARRKLLAVVPGMYSAEYRAKLQQHGTLQVAA